MVLEGFFTDEPIRTRLERAWENLIRVSLKYPHGFQFIEQYSFSPYIYDEVKKTAYKEGWCLSLEKVYQEAIEAKLFRAMEPKFMVQMHYGSIVYTVKASLNHDLTMDEAAIRGLLDSCWKSFSI
ncbi:hypothetical protein D3C75_857760 [compost metagenome]